MVRVRDSEVEVQVGSTGIIGVLDELDNRKVGIGDQLIPKIMLETS